MKVTVIIKFRVRVRAMVVVGWGWRELRYSLMVYKCTLKVRPPAGSPTKSELLTQVSFVLIRDNERAPNRTYQDNGRKEAFG